MGILAFVIILSVLVIIHEAGHFFAARRSGVAVEEFGIGFPPKIAAIRRGSTLFTINAIPFGGFVRLVGENGTDEDQATSFSNARPYKQFFILTAGVIMNFLFAIVMMSVVLGIGVKSDPATVKQDSRAIISQPFTELTISPNGAAAQAGLKSGERVVRVDQQTITNTTDLVTYVQQHEFAPIELVVSRNGTEVPVRITAAQTSTGPKYGLGLVNTVTLRYPWYVAPWYGAKSSVDLGWQTILGFGKLIGELFKGQVSQDVTGPIGIAVITSEVTRFGLVSLLQFAAILSVSLAVLNILPLPALDGGRLFFRIISWIIHRPIRRQLEGAIHTVGFYLLIAFLIFISARDLEKFNVISKLTHLFQ